MNSQEEFFFCAKVCTIFGTHLGLFIYTYTYAWISRQHYCFCNECRQIGHALMLIFYKQILLYRYMRKSAPIYLYVQNLQKFVKGRTMIKSSESSCLFVLVKNIYIFFSLEYTQWCVWFITKRKKTHTHTRRRITRASGFLIGGNRNSFKFFFSSPGFS